MKLLEHISDKKQSIVKIYVPNTIDFDIPWNNDFWKNETLHLLSYCFGGASSMKIEGAYRRDSELVKEDIDLVYSYCDENQLENYMQAIINHCYEIKDKLYQDSVALEVNNVLYFIK